MTKPFEELRQAYKELLADNQQLTADNRKLRQEVTELKQLNDGYVKIIAKNQETNNKLMASVQKQTGGDYISRADAIDAVCNAQCELDVPHYPQCDQIKYCDEIQALLALPSADAVHKPDYSYEADMVKRLRQSDAVQAHGKWQRFNDEHGTYWTGCSNCKGDIPKDKYGIDMYTDFCPNCGAYMRETK